MIINCIVMLFIQKLIVFIVRIKIVDVFSGYFRSFRRRAQFPALTANKILPRCSFDILLVA